ncbi:MAG: hypothetical protein JNL88_00690, partial [Bacteroidia bacterium]|nr:hypothetical protein [Bacteroidia bacterium]
MKKVRFPYLLLVCLLSASGVFAQEQDNLRSRRIAFSRDTLLLDSLSIIPGSLQVRLKDSLLPSASYWFDPFSAKWCYLSAPLDSGTFTDSLELSYRVYPLSFSAPRYLRDRRVLDKTPGKPGEEFYTERPTASGTSLFGLEGLTRSGSISRGVSIGTNQDAVVNSSLNLQLSGRIGGNIDVLAAITDENIPVQAEGNTQQLQEFDRVFIQLSNDRHKLIAGDYDVRNPEGYFMRYFKKAQG